MIWPIVLQALVDALHGDPALVALLTAGRVVDADDVREYAGAGCSYEVTSDVEDENFDGVLVTWTVWAADLPSVAVLEAALRRVVGTHGAQTIGGVGMLVEVEGGRRLPTPHPALRLRSIDVRYMPLHPKSR